MRLSARFISVRRGGFALLTVLFVLLALLVLCTPFLLTARNANESSTQLADRAQLDIALDAAARHQRARLGRSHPSLDPTPDWDSPDELEVTNDFDPEFLNASDPRGIMWDVDSVDLSGFIDLNSVNPHTIANMLGLATRINKPIKSTDEELEVASTAGFEPQGFLWIDGELIHYTKIEGDTFQNCRRGLGTSTDGDGNVLSDGPRPPADHGAGTAVLDQRVFALPIWRSSTPDARARSFDVDEQLFEAEAFALTEKIGNDNIARLLELGSVFGGIGGTRTWQRPARMIRPVQGGLDQTIYVDDTHWFCPGATVEVTDGQTTELALVQRIQGDGGVVLERVLVNDYLAYQAEARVTSRRPVNINTAPPAVVEALLWNLNIRGRNSRVSRREARELTGLILESRPFTGHEDFLRRIVLPAADIEELPSEAEAKPKALDESGSSKMIDVLDALAIYFNSLNANDVALGYSTMPFCYTSRDVYGTELRATVNAPSGVARMSAVRQRVDVVAPQDELFYLFARQQDFDEALRLDREAPYWATGPEATTRYDGNTFPPSRRWAHAGTLGDAPYIPGLSEEQLNQAGEPATADHVFAARDENGWTQLQAARVSEVGRRRGRMLHFDHEPRRLEGRYLPDETLVFAADDEMLQWTGEDEPLMRPIHYSAWIKPASLADGALLDVGSASFEADRVLLGMEAGRLVLQVFDGFGDHNGTTEREVSEVYFELAQGDGPGMPVDVWTHVQIDVRGNRPDQISMLVNGMAVGVRTPGMTRLTAGVSQDSELIPVESTEGFPAIGVARIGNELVEVAIEGPSTLRAIKQETGQGAGFGGRVSRLPFFWDDGQNTWIPEPTSLDALSVDHPNGTTVQHYGYSLPLASNLPSGGSSLPDALGLWRVARVVGLDGAQTPEGDPIFVGLGVFGAGLEASGFTQATGLILRLADDSDNDPDGQVVMSGFNRSGGYAAIIQTAWGSNLGDTVSATSGAALGGVEIIRYSGYTDNILHIASRGDDVSSLENIANLPNEDYTDIGDSRVFVIDWQLTTIGATGQLVQERMQAGTYVIPISLPAPGVDGISGLLPAEAGQSQFAQITHTDQVELTEWVRYDWIDVQGQQLVRDDPMALDEVYRAVTGRIFAEDPDGLGGQPPGGGPGGGGPGGGQGGGGNIAGPAQPGRAGFVPWFAELALGLFEHAPAPAPVAGNVTSPSQDYGSIQWTPFLGEDELETYPLTRAASQAFRFRGVFGTHCHEQPAQTQILPVFRVADGGVDRGRPGRYDSVFVVGPDLDHPGWPLTVHRSWATVPVALTPGSSWEQAEPGVNVATALQTDEGSILDIGYLDGIYVALQQPCPEPMAAGSVAGVQTNVSDTRLLTRLVKHPSGERPRTVLNAGVGTGFAGASPLGVPSSTIDEVLFGDTRFGESAASLDTPISPDEAALGAQFQLAQPLDANAEIAVVYPTGILTSLQRINLINLFLSEIPADGGLLRIGEEIIAYESRDPETGQITFAANGRELLGTRRQPHQEGEAVTWLEHIPVAILAASISEGDATLPVASLEGFPSQGTVLIGNELLHYTRQREGSLEMPRFSSEPGKKDEKGDGLFRGRFGSTPGAHVAGEPVILFPFRYWDRWAERADAPELAYFGFQMSQPSAWWSSYFWEWEPAPVAGSTIGMMLRRDPDVPWDADPEMESELFLTFDGTDEGRELPILKQADQIEWRAFVRYDPGAFDPVEGFSHGWKATPRFRRLGVSYLAPHQLLRSVER